MKGTKKEQLVKITKHLLNCLLVEYDVEAKLVKERIDSDKLLNTFTDLIIKEVTVRTNLN